MAYSPHFPLLSIPDPPFLFRQLSLACNISAWFGAGFFTFLLCVVLSLWVKSEQCVFIYFMFGLFACFKAMLFVLIVYLSVFVFMYTIESKKNEVNESSFVLKKKKICLTSTSSGIIIPLRKYLNLLPVLPKLSYLWLIFIKLY